MACILVAEDEPHLSSLSQMTLKNSGYSVLSASDGEEALFLFQVHPVDLALLDVRMPKLTGFDVCKGIRETSRIPIVMLTALNIPDSVSLALVDCGADEYIVKPTTFREIVVQIEALLRRTGWEINLLVPDEIVVEDTRTA